MTKIHWRYADKTNETVCVWKPDKSRIETHEAWLFTGFKAMAERFGVEFIFHDIDDD